MKKYHLCFFVCALAAIVFFGQTQHLTKLEEEAAVLINKAERRSDYFSSQSLGRFGRAFFDGLTFGKFAEEGVFTEAKRFEREGEALNEHWTRIKMRYSAAERMRKWSLWVVFLSGIFGLVLRAEFKVRQVPSLNTQSR